MLRRGSVDFNQIQCRKNKENFAELTPKKRSWKGLFSRNKSVSNDLDSYGDEKKTMSLSTFKRRVSYDVGDSGGFSTPRSQSSINLRELGSSEANTRPPTGKKGRKKKLEISSPLGIRASSFVSYVGGMNQLERTSTAPELELRQAAKAVRAKNALKKAANDNVSTGRNVNENTSKRSGDDEFKLTLEVINDVSIDETVSIQAHGTTQPVKMNEKDNENVSDVSCKTESCVKEENLVEFNELIVCCSNVDKNNGNVNKSVSPVDESSLRNSMWIEKYDEIARSCSSAASVPAKENGSNEEKQIVPKRSQSSSSHRSNTSTTPQQRPTAEIRNSILNRGSRELQSNFKYSRNFSGDSNKRSQSVDLPSDRPAVDKRASCFSDSGLPESAAINGVLTIDWIPVMRRSLTDADDFKECVPGVKLPARNIKSNEHEGKGTSPTRHCNSRPFSSYDNHPLPQKDDNESDTDRKAKNRPSMYDNLLLAD